MYRRMKLINQWDGMCSLFLPSYACRSQCPKKALLLAANNLCLFFLLLSKSIVYAWFAWITAQSIWLYSIWIEFHCFIGNIWHSLLASVQHFNTAEHIVQLLFEEYTFHNEWNGWKKYHAGQFERLKIAIFTHAKWNGNGAHICNITLPNAQQRL